MGQKVSKVIGRPFKNFNIENRAHKLIDKDLKPKAAPLHESSKDYIENFIKGVFITNLLIVFFSL